MQFSHLFETFKRQARANLACQQGQQLHRRRGVKIETIFGHLKFNKKYRRFLLRGLEKANIEYCPQYRKNVPRSGPNQYPIGGKWAKIFPSKNSYPENRKQYVTINS